MGPQKSYWKNGALKTVSGGPNKILLQVAPKKLQILGVIAGQKKVEGDGRRTRRSGMLGCQRG